MISQLRNVFIHDVRVEVPTGKPDKGYPMARPELRMPAQKEDTNIHYTHGAPWYDFSIDTNSALIPHNVFPSSISGIPGHPDENVVLKNITIIYDGGCDSSLAYLPLESFKRIPEGIADYPEFSMFGEIPLWGLYVRHLNGLILNNIRLVTKKKDYRTALMVDDAKKVTLQNFDVEGATTAPVLFFNNAKPLWMTKVNVQGDRENAIKIYNTNN